MKGVRTAMAAQIEVQKHVMPELEDPIDSDWEEPVYPIDEQTGD